MRRNYEMLSEAVRLMGAVAGGGMPPMATLAQPALAGPAAAPTPAALRPPRARSRRSPNRNRPPRKRASSAA